MDRLLLIIDIWRRKVRGRNEKILFETGRGESYFIVWLLRRTHKVTFPIEIYRFRINHSAERCLPLLCTNFLSQTNLVAFVVTTFSSILSHSYLWLANNYSMMLRLSFRSAINIFAINVKPRSGWRAHHNDFSIWVRLKHINRLLRISYIAGSAHVYANTFWLYRSPTSLSYNVTIRALS